MFKKYDHRLVRSYQSYTLRELCRLYKRYELHDKTIRSWIKSGDLDTILDGNKLLIYGAVFKQFLRNRNKNRKRNLSLHEFFCCGCKKINAPIDNIILSVKIQNNGSILAVGMCPTCAFEMKRLYKRSEVSEITKLFGLESPALIVLSDISCSTYNAHPRVDQKSAELESEITILSRTTQNLISTNHLIHSTEEIHHV